MVDLNEMLSRLEIIERREKIAIKEQEELDKIAKLPFHLKIQEKCFKVILKRVEDTQRLNMESLCKKDKIHKDDWKDEFCLFWIGFLKGEYKSINQYLKRKNYDV